MLMTSAEAAKYLRKLNEELESLRNREEQSRQFTVSLGEKEEDLRPAYDYEAARDAMLALEEKIRRVKHAVLIRMLVSLDQRPTLASLHLNGFLMGPISKSPNRPNHRGFGVNI